LKFHLPGGRVSFPPKLPCPGERSSIRGGDGACGGGAEIRGAGGGDGGGAETRGDGGDDCRMTAGDGIGAGRGDSITRGISMRGATVTEEGDGGT
jgi:hypothetical protein